MNRIILLGIMLFISCTSMAQTGEDTTRGPLLVAKEDETDVNTRIFTKVEQEASFPGGNDGWRQYLIANLNASVPVDNKAKKGTYQVVIRFIVSKDSTLSDVQAETKHGYGIEAECIRVIKKGPKWVPARQNGRNVNAYRRQPITFVVTEQ